MSHPCGQRHAPRRSSIRGLCPVRGRRDPLYWRSDVASRDPSKRIHDRDSCVVLLERVVPCRVSSCVWMFRESRTIPQRRIGRQSRSPFHSLPVALTSFYSTFRANLSVSLYAVQPWRLKARLRASLWVAAKATSAASRKHAALGCSLAACGGRLRGCVATLRRGFSRQPPSPV
jgi:hypothetical protein